jgi:CheY-like chemotaxis protein
MKRKDPSYKYKYAMLVDDNELDNFINQNIIEANHFASKVYVNSGSISALEFLSNLTVSGVDALTIFPEIIFIDINMPMMNGFQFIDNLKKNLSEKFVGLKLVILTSSVDPNDMLKAEEICKGIIFLNKPLTQDMLNQL